MVLQCSNGVGSNSREEQNLTAQKYNFNTVWFNFQTYILFSVNLVSLVTLRFSGAYILTAQRSNSNAVWFNIHTSEN
jgi:protein-tyrosine phosphatase